MPKADETPPFRFKRFQIEQARTAMKVGFDGIVLGAWANVSGCNRILDVGTGTGLIALMLAQRTSAQFGDVKSDVRIDGIDIDENAAAEATANVAASPWPDRIRTFHSSLAEFAPDGELYDLIVCNPPFFESGQASRHRPRAQARHAAALPLVELVRDARRLVNQRGVLSIIVPSDAETSCIELAGRAGWTVRRRLTIRPLPQKPKHRVALEFRLTTGTIVAEELTIELRHHEYTDAFRRLTRDFYLAF